MGLRPSVLQELLEQGDNVPAAVHNERESVPILRSRESLTKTHSLPRVVYEITSTPNSTKPRLRLRVKVDQQLSRRLSSNMDLEDLDFGLSEGGSPEDVAGYTQISSPKYVSISV